MVSPRLTTVYSLKHAIVLISYWTLPIILSQIVCKGSNSVNSYWANTKTNTHKQNTKNLKKWRVNFTHKRTLKFTEVRFVSCIFIPANRKNIYPCKKVISHHQRKIFKQTISCWKKEQNMSHICEKKLQKNYVIFY